VCFFTVIEVQSVFHAPGEYVVCTAITSRVTFSSLVGEQECAGEWQDPEGMS
jgi:hypothetical protein